MSVLDQIVVSLGPLVAPAEPEGTFALPFLVEADQTEGWNWRASNGDSGSTDRVRVDLAPYLEGSGDAELRFGEDGPGYALPDELAESLVLAIYIRDE